MDPNLFRLDWERVTEVLATMVILSFLVERGLSIVFGHRWFVATLRKKGFKEPIAFALSAFICWRWKFDALSMIILTDSVTVPGTLITAGVIAGGSHASIALFRDFIGFRSTAEKEAAEKEQKAQKDADTAERIKAELNRQHHQAGHQQAGVTP